MEVAKGPLFPSGCDLGGRWGGIMTGRYYFDLGGAFFPIFFPIVMTRGVTRLCLSVCGIHL